MGVVPEPILTLILLGGSSGSGKSYLAERYGRPHVELDNFYRELAEDSPQTPLPHTAYGEVDWDHPGTWNCDAAVNSVLHLLRTGSMEVPHYSISTSSYSGYSTVTRAGGPVVAEGIFVDEIRAPLIAHGVDVRAYYIDVSPITTAVRRLVRDIKERRKPLPFLLRRGWALYRAEGSVRRRYVNAGFIPTPKARIRSMLASASTVPDPR